MADQKITALTELTTPAGVDLLAIVDDPAGTPITKKITLDSLKATGAEINTGTDDVKRVTPKAIADSDLMLAIDEDDMVSDLATKVPTQQSVKKYVDDNAGSSADGWTAVTDDWAYASATTITVPSGAALLYAVGDKIKLTQTSVKYFYIIGVADTVLTITAGTTYTLANATITLPYYSHQTSPVGFPSEFAWLPVWTLSAGTLTTTYSTQIGKFTVNGRTVTATFDMFLNVVSEATAGKIFNVSMPISSVFTHETFGIGTAVFLESAVSFNALIVEGISTTLMSFWKGNTGASNRFGVDPAITLSNNDSLKGTVTYVI